MSSAQMSSAKESPAKTKTGSTTVLLRSLLFLAAAALLLPATPAFAARSCGKSLHVSFIESLQSYTAFIENVVVEDASASYSTTFPICGAPNSIEPGWAPHGDPLSNGTATMSINNGKMDIDVNMGNRYLAYHAHLYDLQGRYKNSDIGQSTICWTTADYLHVNNWARTGTTTTSIKSTPKAVPAGG